MFLQQLSLNDYQQIQSFIIRSDVTLLFWIKYFLSPGLILSGEYPQKNLDYILIRFLFLELVHKYFQYSQDILYSHK